VANLAREVQYLEDSKKKDITILKEQLKLEKSLKKENNELHEKVLELRSKIAAEAGEHEAAIEVIHNVYKDRLETSQKKLNDISLAFDAVMEAANIDSVIVVPLQK